MKTNFKNKKWVITGLTCVFYLFSSFTISASTDSPAPQTIPFPATNNAALTATPGDLTAPIEETITIRGPEKPLSYGERTYLPIPPFFYTESRTEEVSPKLKKLLREILIPKEAVYFQTDVGLDKSTGMPYDHLRIRLKESLLSEIGNYTAASKLSLLIPFLVKVIQEKPELEKVALYPKDARDLLKRNLTTILVFINRYPEYHGFLPWVDIRPNATIAPANTKIPSLDNGQLTWALAAVVAAFEDSPDEELNELASLASTIISYQNYRRFYDPEKKMLYGTVQLDPETNQWYGDETYYLNDMFEGTLAVLWGVLNGQIPEDAWDNLAAPTADYITEKGEKITTFSGFKASFHEHWALAFLPLLDSPLGPLYQNYLYVQADHARRNHMPGFLSTAYDPKGIYRQMGIPAIAHSPVDRDDVSVVFATAMSMLIAPQVGASWLAKLYEFEELVTPYGALESVGPDGYSDILTADGKGMTLLAVTGGVIVEIQKYLRERAFPKSRMSTYVKLIELLHSKYKQVLQQRDYRPIYFPSNPFPEPPEKTFVPRAVKLPDPGPVFDILAHLQTGHLHGKNVRSVGHKTLEQDVAPNKPFSFEYEIPTYFAYFDQWAFRGTYLDKAPRIADMGYLSVTVPTNSDPIQFETELKSDDITLAAVVIDTTKPGILSTDGKWKTLVQPIDPIPEADFKPFNYLSVAIHDPRYLLSKFTTHKREGTIHIQKIWLSKAPPAQTLYHNVIQSPTELELIRFWRPTHGGLPFYKNEAKALLNFSAGPGWRGGYIPYTNLSNFEYMYVRARSTSMGCNCFYVELKNEGTDLLRYKIPIHIPSDKEWHIFEIPIPRDIRHSLNYLAISDPHAPLEIASIFLSITPISNLQVEKYETPSPNRRPLECKYRPCESGA